MNKIATILLTILVTGCSVAVTGLCTACGANDADARHPDAALDGSALPDSEIGTDSSFPDLGVAPDSSSDVDLGGDPPDLGPSDPDTGVELDAGPPDLGGPVLRCPAGEVMHDGFCYYETTWTGITVTPRQNCYDSGGTPVEWRSIAEQHVLETYIPGPSDMVAVGLYDAHPPRGEWSWLSDMSLATAIDWAVLPTSGQQALLTGSGAIGGTAMYEFCVKPAM